MTYRCVATSVAGFIQQLSTAYIAHGYRYYAVRHIPERKDPARVDAKIVRAYELELSKWQRARRKRAGLANVQYIRHGHFAVLLASGPVGGHKFFRECPDYRDVQKKAIRYAGYSVGYSYSTNTKRWHASVRIDREQYLRVKAYLLDIATKRSAESLSEELRTLRFEPYARVARQYLTLLKAVNGERRRSGMPELPTTCLRLHRKSIFPFAERPVAEEVSGGEPAPQRP